MKNRVYILRKILCLLAAALLCSPMLFVGCAVEPPAAELLRLHIRANSNSQEDQAVKLKVRDAVNEYACTHIQASSFAEAYSAVSARLDDIKKVAEGVLRRNGFVYGARAYVRNEYFPTRVYKDVTVPEGYYDALIVELGAAKGDNWWCVVYPPLCYDGSTQYRSLIYELLK